jgi:hypothetical protein
LQEFPFLSSPVSEGDDHSAIIHFHVRSFVNQTEAQPINFLCALWKGKKNYKAPSIMLRLHLHTLSAKTARHYSKISRKSVRTCTGNVHGLSRALPPFEKLKYRRSDDARLMFHRGVARLFQSTDDR